MNEVFVIPPLLSVVCVLLGAGAFFAPHIWLIGKLRAADSAFAGQSLTRCTYGNVMAMFFSGVAVSQVLAVISGQGVLWFEMILMLALVFGAFALGRVGGLSGVNLVRAVPLYWLVRNVAVLAFALAGFALFQLLLSVFGFARDTLQLGVAPVREATFVSGGVLIATLYKLYMNVRHWDVVAVHNGFSRLIWPLVLGLFFWMLPLLLNEIAHSAEFHEMLNRTPPLQRA